MPYRQVINTNNGLATSDKQSLNRELDLLRQEITELKSTVSAIRALLVAATAVGAGYNVAGTVVQPDRFTTF
jgi:prefoldin subunit 5